MIEKLRESKRVAIFVFCVLLLSVLNLVAWMLPLPKLGVGPVDVEVQRTLMGALRDTFSYGLPMLIAGVSATDWREAQAKSAEVAPQ